MTILTKEAYLYLIEGDMKELEKYPASLEKSHIKSVLLNSVDMLFPPPPKPVFFLGEPVKIENYRTEIFTVVGIRENEIEVRGDFSEGTHNVSQTDWIKIEKVSKFKICELCKSKKN